MTSELRSGSRFGDHVVLRFLGAGAQGSVYLARHVATDTLHALKVLARPTPEALLAAHGEVALTETLRSPHLAGVEAVLAHAGHVALLLPFVDGCSLLALHEAAPLDPDQSAAVIRGIAAGLRELHRRDVVHRDVKPPNVLLRLGTLGVVPVLIDFGVARRLGQIPARSPVGTEGYMAPEQRAGGRVTPAADLYALAAVWLDLLTGALPDDDDPHLDAVPARWRPILGRMLAADPADRGSSDQLIEDLGAFDASPLDGPVAAAVRAIRDQNRRRTQTADGGGREVVLAYAPADGEAADRAAGVLEEAGAAVLRVTDDAPVPPAAATADQLVILWSTASFTARALHETWAGAVAREASGEAVRTLVVALDPGAPPRRLSSETHVGPEDLAIEPGLIGGWLSGRADAPTVARRLRMARVRRADALARIRDHVAARQHVVVFVPRMCGGKILTGQVLTAFADRNARNLLAHPRGEESVSAYDARMAAALGQAEGDQIATVTGWGDAPPDHQLALGSLLRMRAEGAGDGQSRLTIVAIGGLSVYEQKFRTGIHSLLNNAHPVYLDEFSVAEIGELLSVAGVNRALAPEVHARTGGHPHLVAVLLDEWARNPAGGMAGAEGALDRDTTYLRPTLARLRHAHPRAFARLLALVDGGRPVPEPVGDAQSDDIRLYFEGLLRRTRAPGFDALEVRCAAVGRVATALGPPADDR